MCVAYRREDVSEVQVGGVRVRFRVPGFLFVEDGDQHKGTPQGHCEKRHAALPPRARLMWMQRTALAICTANVRDGRRFPSRPFFFERMPQVFPINAPDRRAHDRRDDPRAVQWPCAEPPSRSEEHTSELQSLMRISYAVFCLKKKKI